MKLNVNEDGKLEIQNEPQSEGQEQGGGAQEVAAPAPVKEAEGQEGGQDAVVAEQPEQPSQPQGGNFEELFREKTGFETIDQLNERIQNLQKRAELVPEDDPFLQTFIEKYREGEDLTPYIQAKSINYDEIGDSDVLRNQLRREYPELNASQFDRLYEKEIIERYNLDSDDEDEKAIGMARLKRRADELRNELKAEQQKYLAPDPAQRRKESTPEELEAQQREQAEQIKKVFSQDPATQALLKDRKVNVRYGDETFSYELPNAEDLLEQAVDTNKFFQQFAKEDGSGPDLDKFYRVAAFAADPQKYEQELIKYGQSLGTEAVISEIENPAQVVKTQPLDRQTGDTRSDLLEAFLRNGVKKTR